MTFSTRHTLRQLISTAVSKLTLRQMLVLMLSAVSPALFAQSPIYSENVLKYDYPGRKFIGDKVQIPIDQPFTISVDGLSAKDVIAIHAYQVDFIGGKRKKVQTTFKDLKGNSQTAAIKDLVLNFRKDSSPLEIYVNPLRPNATFDIHIIYNLQAKERAELYKVNRGILALKKGEDTTKVGEAYTEFRKLLIDDISKSTFVSVKFKEYYDTEFPKLQGIYSQGTDVNKYTYENKLTVEQLQSMALSSSKEVPAYRKLSNLLTLLKSGKIRQFQDGSVNIAEYSPSKNPNDFSDFTARTTSLTQNQAFLDSLLLNLDNLILYNKVSTNTATLETVRANLSSMLENAIKPNLKFTKDALKKLDEATNAIEGIKASGYLAGSNQVTTLKAEGGQLLFMDFGLTNILARGMDRKFTYIPRLYLGASIYFRPIDKNTRLNKLPRRRQIADRHLGAWLDPKTKQEAYGPDYQIASMRSIWQHLSLNLGFTLGSLPNADFDNFYNGTSLLIGPAYRFRRAFKFSAGAAFLKRSSYNPLISEKKVVMGTFASLSVDIDFIETFKDIRTILSK